MRELEKRQVHLDFHTSGHIAGIGAEFSKRDFQQALLAGKVTSITVFAKCHHGYCYYPTAVGTMHPGLDFDLLGAMIEAAHEIGVKAPIYITAGWSALDAEAHPEWRVKRADGTDATEGFDVNAGPKDKKPECSWQNLCLNDGGYAEHIYALTREICRKYPVDGIFYDICFYDTECYCAECRQGMLAMGLDAESEADAKQYFVRMHQRFMQACRDAVAETHPDASVFFNGGAEVDNPEYHALQTHFELEDLPTAWGGYDKLPLRARYFARSGKPYLGMTGKFHMAWGEFGGFKTPEALRYEVAAMMACGAGCSVGDQLHPSGRMEAETYRIIGEAYGYAAEIEPYCYNTQPVPGLGVYLSRSGEANEGVAKALLDEHYDFDIVHEGDFTPFSTVIIPEGAVLDSVEQTKLRAYLAGGGRLLLFGDSLVQQGGPLADIGCESLGPTGFDNDYLQATSPAVAFGVQAPVLMYLPAWGLGPVQPGAQSLADTLPPYFNRSYERYCGHKNAPYNAGAERRSAAVQKENVVYAAHPVGSIYQRYGSQYHRQYFAALLRLAHPQPVVQAGLPSAGRVALARQAALSRYCVHLLYAAPLRRGAVDVIEDMPPLFDTTVCLRVPEPVKRVEARPEGVELEFTQRDGVVTVRVPRFQMQTVLVFAY